MLIAASGAGKSDCLLQFKLNPNTFVLNDMTRYGLWEKFRESTKEKSFVTHCIIPDFSQVMMQNPFYTGSICSTMMALMEEGTDSVMTKNIRHNIPNTRLGFLTSMAKDDFEAKQKDSRSVLLKTGFLSRFLLFRYQYKEETAVLVARAISEGKTPEPILLDPPVSRVEVHVDSDQVLQLFPGVTEQQAQQALDDDWSALSPPKGEAQLSLVPRKIKQTMTLLKAIALSRGERAVAPCDVAEVRRLRAWLESSQYQTL